MPHDRDAVLSFFLAQKGLLTRFLTRLLGSPDAAEDIAQETWLRLASGAVPADVANPRAFVFRVAGNLARDRLRRDRTRGRFVVSDYPYEEIAGAVPDAERAVGGRQQVEILIHIINELPPRCREVFILRRFDDLNQAEIAERLGISRNMVEKHLRKAMYHCAARLKENPEKL